jgi:hypothetical protein
MEDVWGREGDRVRVLDHVEFGLHVDMLHRYIDIRPSREALTRLLIGLRL